MPAALILALIALIQLPASLAQAHHRRCVIILSNPRSGSTALANAYRADDAFPFLEPYFNYEKEKPSDEPATYEQLFSCDIFQDKQRAGHLYTLYSCRQLNIMGCNMTSGYLGNPITPSCRKCLHGNVTPELLQEHSAQCRAASSVMIKTLRPTISSEFSVSTDTCGKV